MLRLHCRAWAVKSRAYILSSMKHTFNLEHHMYHMYVSSKACTLEHPLLSALNRRELIHHAGASCISSSAPCPPQPRLDSQTGDLMQCYLQISDQSHLYP
jgi:hypothetical protein